ncbi:MAG: PBP1A family penicillin-binding protein [Rhizobiaceae bacterium]|nr:PBP1A family penicillin-binding protein [Rhizobiaceae bacterium]
MARKSRPKQRSKQRIEPRFSDKSEGDIRASRSRRVDAGAKKAKPSRKTSRKKSKKPSWFWRIMRLVFRPAPRLFYWGVVFSLWSGIIVAGIVGYYAAQLPSADDWIVPERPPNMRIVADDKSLVGNRGVTGGKALRLEDMSPHIAQAVIAIEDRRFHSHFGFDPIGFTRAMFRNVMQKRLREGGSTLTQQLAKNLFLTPQRTFGRKVQELILAFWLEAKYSKAEILELYLNRVYFGAGATGVDAAARRYFGKSAKHVTIAEAALLAGLLKAPSKYAPTRDPILAQRRAQTVLAAMQREGYIKPGYVNVKNIKPGENARHYRSGPEHFVADMIAKRVKHLIGEVKQDIVVETSLSPYMMTAAQESLSGALGKHGKSRRVSQGALVAMAPDGAIRALIGGRNYGESQFNRVIEARRQPGSAFKTFVWLNAIERGHSPQTVMNDEPVRIGKWQPENYDQKFRGAVTLSQAFSQSLNTISAQLTMQAGPTNVAKTAKRLGIDSKLTANASLSLGTSEVNLLELSAAYIPFANGGLKANPYLINRISTNGGKVLYQRPAALPLEVIDPSVLGMMNAMLRDVVENGTGRAARLSGHVAGGKTGTSQGFRDALFIGHTAHLVTGVWFGNDDNQPTRKVTGGSIPAIVWKDFMTAALRDLPRRALPGQPVYLASLPVEIPLPKFRARLTGQNAKIDRQTANLRTRVHRALENRGQKTILDLIVGN